MSDFVQDVRFAARMLRRGWGVTLLAVGSLAVAIGGNTAVFGLINTFLFTPLSIENAEELIVVQERTLEQPPTLSTLSTSLPTADDFARRSRTTSAWATYRPTVLGLRQVDRSEPISSAEVSQSFFEVIGTPVFRGRAFLAEESVPGGRKVAVVTQEFWERTQGDTEALGAVLTLSGDPVEVVGVMPPDFSFIFGTADIIVPLTETAASSPRDRRDVIAIARIADGFAMEQVREDITGIAADLRAEYPEVQENWTTDVFNARTDIPDTTTKLFYALLQGSVFFVLLIACTNITNLLLARAQERRREIALRTVLGAGRGRLTRQLLTESGLLVFTGAVLGLLLGWVGIRLIAASFGNLLPPNFTPTLDGTVILFTGGVSILAGLIFGLAPVGQTLRTAQSEVLKEGSGKSSQGSTRKLVTRGLVVAEIALSLVALGGGGMLVRSFVALRTADPGFDGSGLVTASVGVPESKYPDEEQRLVFLDQLLDRVGRLDGASEPTLANALPRNFAVPTDTFAVAGRPREGVGAAPRAFSLKVSPNYDDALGVEVLQGRFFSENDRRGTPPVAVVNRSFAERWLEGLEPLGQSLIVAGESRQIVGVVEDIQQLLFPTPGAVQAEAIFMPAAQHPMDGYSVLALASDDPALLKEPLRTGVQELDPDVTISQVATMEERVDQFFTGVTVFNSILGGFGVLGMLLAAFGTYGVLAYQVTQRRHEIGIRMAIGAEGREVLRMVTRQGLVMAVIGLAIGGVMLVPLTRLVRSLLAGFTTVSADTGLYVAGVLFAVTLAASLLPAWRAASMDPVMALRDD
ncbi:MAG: ABC transporter permease [Gemmatimonadota bacterium]